MKNKLLKLVLFPYFPCFAFVVGCSNKIDDSQTYLKVSYLNGTDYAGNVVQFECDGNLEEVDWGDGTINKEYSHAYSEKEKREYTIKLKGDISSFSMLKGNYYVTYVHLGNTIKTIPDEAFQHCSALTSIDIPSGVTTIGDSAFYWCSNLRKLTIPDGVISIGEKAFSECDIWSLNLPDSIATIGDMAFFHNRNLRLNTKDDLSYLGTQNNKYAILVKTLNTSIRTAIIDSNCKFIMDRTFYDECVVLESVTIPCNVTSIGSLAFSYCPSLKNVIFENNSSLTSIGERAFEQEYGCRASLVNITIPGGVAKIGSCTFNECTSMTDIYCEAPSQPSGWDINWKGNCPATVHFGHL